MSLIGEALKRARLESARRDGEERGTAHSSVPAYLPARRRSRVGVVAVAVALAGLAGAGVVYWLLRPSSTSERSARPAILGKDQTADVAGFSSREAVGSSTASTEAPEPLVPAVAAPPTPSSRAEPRDLEAGTPEAPGLRQGPSANARDGGAEPPATPPAPSGARVFVSVAQIGATRLELDGIVASPTDPVAMINRKLLGIGEGIDGWLVEKVEPKQVTLRGGSETIILRLR